MRIVIAMAALIAVVVPNSGVAKSKSTAKSAKTSKSATKKTSAKNASKKSKSATAEAAPSAPKNQQTVIVLKGGQADGLGHKTRQKAPLDQVLTTSYQENAEVRREHNQRTAEIRAKSEPQKGPRPIAIEVGDEFAVSQGGTSDENLKPRQTVGVSESTSVLDSDMKEVDTAMQKEKIAE